MFTGDAATRRPAAGRQSGAASGMA